MMGLNFSFSVASPTSKWEIEELNEAVVNGTESDVKNFLRRRPGYNVNTLDEEGYGAIHYAINSQNPVNKIKLLLEMGADINLRTPDESTGENLIDYRVSPKKYLSRRFNSKM